MGPKAISVYTLKVSSQQSSMRLDIFLLKFSQEKDLGLSREYVQKLIHDGFVESERPVPLKPHQKVKEGQVWKIRLPLKEEEGQPKPEEIKLDVVYEDADLAVVNKPVGLVVHPAPGNAEHTLVNALLHRFKGLSDVNPQRPGIVHRLDKDTSGLIVVAKNNYTHLALTEQFARHTITRKYIAVVKGEMEFDENSIDAPIGRHPIKRKSMCVGLAPHAKSAKTHYRTLKRTSGFSLVELSPFTGRTHQLRVHMSFIGHPIAGDRWYGKNDCSPRLALHARSLGFIHPRSKKYLEFNSPIPKEFEELLKSP